MLLLNTQCITNNFVFSRVIIVFIVSINKYNELEQFSAASSLKTYPLLAATINSAYSSLTVITCYSLQKVPSKPGRGAVILFWCIAHLPCSINISF